MMNHTTGTIDGLNLGTVAHPASPGQAVSFFANWQSAWQHLRDHLLTAPECLAWQLVSPAYPQIVNPQDPDARWSFSEQARTTEGRTAQPLYDLYLAAVSQDTQDSIVLGWCRGSGHITVCLGTSGILAMYTERAVITAFLPDQGSGQATRAGQQAELSRGLPREGGMRAGRVGRRSRESIERDQQLRQQREAAWSAAQRLYHRVFKPAVQFVKHCHHRNRDLYGRLIRGDYALLKDVLPHLSQLKYEHWVLLRQRCGRNEPALPVDGQASE
jgi:hypothetical protein